MIRAANASMRASCGSGGDLGPRGAVGDLPVQQQHAGVGGVAGHRDLGLGREDLVALVVLVEDRRGPTTGGLPRLQRLITRSVGEPAGGGTPEHPTRRHQQLVRHTLAAGTAGVVGTGVVGTGVVGTGVVGTGVVGTGVVGTGVVGTGVVGTGVVGTGVVGTGVVGTGVVGTGVVGTGVVGTGVVGTGRGRDRGRRDRRGRDRGGRDRLGRDRRGRDGLGRDRRGRDRLGRDRLGRDRLGRAAAVVVTVSSGRPKRASVDRNRVTALGRGRLQRERVTAGGGDDLVEVEDDLGTGGGVLYRAGSDLRTQDRRRRGGQGLLRPTLVADPGQRQRPGDLTDREQPQLGALDRARGGDGELQVRDLGVAVEPADDQLVVLAESSGYDGRSRCTRRRWRPRARPGWAPRWRAYPPGRFRHRPSKRPARLQSGELDYGANRSPPSTWPLLGPLMEKSPAHRCTTRAQPVASQVQ